MEKMRFEKYHGLGNDYLVYDCYKNVTQLDSVKVQRICERHYGFGSDGILSGPGWGKKVWKKDSNEVLEERFGVTIWNPDGSQAEKSGNGVQIFARYLKDSGYVTGNSCVVEMMGGEVQVDYLNPSGSSIRTSMGTLAFDAKSIGAVHVPDGYGEEMVEVPLVFDGEIVKCSCVSVGNPHCVIAAPELSRERVCQLGKAAEQSPYFPKRINMNLVRVVDRQHMEMEIYERGAGYTLASGTSCCAAAGVMYRIGKVDSRVLVSMPGGTLEVEMTPEGLVYLTGEVQKVGTMILTPSFLEK